MHKNDYLNDPNDYVFKSMASLEENSQHPYIMDVFNDAFARTKGIIGIVYSLIKDRNVSIDNYVLSKLRITCYGARNLFISTLLSKLKRMEAVFDTNDKSNIILVMNEKGKSISLDSKDASKKDSVVGFSYIHDPLDRIYIKTDSLTLNSRSTMPTWERNREIQKKIKNLSNIMCHESVHALGTPEDYFYHNSIDEGEYDTIENTLIRTEIALRRGRGVNDAFINMCTLYFMSNPVYQTFELNSLLQPETLGLLFQYDDYLRALILINNPDTITVVINDLATLG
ncbi:hypothetical protein [Symbiopectobacterium purcellii]|uniref:Uncharacterized protein n=1 Tax=Symbiopectobacterium purcellii TaxID=2871826 RepID=A0ABX9AHB3_9ENTR|nr:hypothetical protein [Symbiopectobacterium purcellii]QZN94547.1 hypothetical protein K6K13_14740 [Symbiopectobacterium purcellii]